jgi:uncharacterized protein YcgI (DUF1989 family)
MRYHHSHGSDINKNTLVSIFRFIDFWPERKVMKKIAEKVMLPGSGLAVEVKQGQHLRVIDLEGQQVVEE